jgi:hypothetical protein
LTVFFDKNVNCRKIGQQHVSANPHSGGTQGNGDPNPQVKAEHSGGVLDLREEQRVAQHRP